MRVAIAFVLVGCGRFAFDPSASDAPLDVPLDTAIEAQLSVGGYNSCALDATGVVSCWGRGFQGGLGDGTISDRPFAAPITLPIPARALNTSDAGTCAIGTDDSMWCWGNNDRGQLGVGHNQRVFVPEQVPVADAVDVAEVTLGHMLACIRRTTGHVACAGTSTLLGADMDQLMFVELAGIDDAQLLAAGDEFVCALRVNGSVTCWGANLAGAFGNGTVTWSPTPVPGPVGPYTSLAAGDRHACGILGGANAGEVDCWGYNVHGQLGDNTFDDRTQPVRVIGLSGAVQLAGSSRGTCALDTGGRVRCWGTNLYGELGDGGTDHRAQLGPVVLDEAEELSSHTGVHNCARKRDQSIWCWGENSFGQLGSGTLGGTSAVPVRVLSM
ncbi:MAG: hypothetical protein SFX73_16620 [Kofleriaceae bacterium]|nr:hypothetical protein [Kofleriaceae bacterium]